jgi:hypothetical protein
MDGNLDDTSENLIFRDLRYFMINSNDPNVWIRVDLNHHLDFFDLLKSIQKIEDLLKSNGAIEERYLTRHVTHVICDVPANSTEFTDAKELFELTIVKVSA